MKGNAHDRNRISALPVAGPPAGAMGAQAAAPLGSIASGPTPSLAADAAAALHSLVVNHARMLGPKLTELPVLPALPELRQVNAAIQAARGSLGFREALLLAASGLGHDSLHVRFIAAQQMLSLLRSHSNRTEPSPRETLNPGTIMPTGAAQPSSAQLPDVESRGSSNPHPGEIAVLQLVLSECEADNDAVTTAVAALLRCLAEESKTSQGQALCLVCAKCLGELGAIDPSRLPALSRAAGRKALAKIAARGLINGRDSPGRLMQQPGTGSSGGKGDCMACDSIGCGAEDLAVGLITGHLAGMLRAAVSSDVHDAATHATQEILKLFNRPAGQALAVESPTSKPETSRAGATVAPGRSGGEAELTHDSKDRQGVQLPAGAGASRHASRLWERLSEDVREVVTPSLTSRFHFSPAASTRGGATAGGASGAASGGRGRDWDAMQGSGVTGGVSGGGVGGGGGGGGNRVRAPLFEPGASFRRWLSRWIIRMTSGLNSRMGEGAEGGAGAAVHAGRESGAQQAGRAASAASAAAGAPLPGAGPSSSSPVSVSQVFAACSALLQHDEALALYLLPHVVLHVVCQGSEAARKEVQLEIEAVLRHALRQGEAGRRIVTDGAIVGRNAGSSGDVNGSSGAAAVSGGSAIGPAASAQAVAPAVGVVGAPLTHFHRGDGRGVLKTAELPGASGRTLNPTAADHRQDEVTLQAVFSLLDSLTAWHHTAAGTLLLAKQAIVTGRSPPSNSISWEVARFLGFCEGVPGGGGGGDSASAGAGNRDGSSGGGSGGNRAGQPGQQNQLQNQNQNQNQQQQLVLTSRRLAAAELTAGKVGALVRGIDRRVLAGAAWRCGAHARALLQYELFAREQSGSVNRAAFHGGAYRVADAVAATAAGTSEMQAVGPVSRCS